MATVIQTKFNCLFIDIGGVLLTDGWGHKSRELAAKTYELDYAEMEARHHKIVEAYEIGQYSLDEYLNRVVFYKPRHFSKLEFRKFIFNQSRPNTQMIELIHAIKLKYGMKIIAVSNEARELNIHRIANFQLNKLIDFFISSSFVHLRKPDPAIFQLALDVSQVTADQTIYIENTALFTEVATRFGIHSILHTDYGTTCTQLEWFGLEADESHQYQSAFDIFPVEH